MLALLFAASLAYFASLRLRTYLHPFQQEEYDSRRFLKWYREKRAFDRYLTLGLLIAVPFSLIQPQATCLIIALWCIYRSRNEPDPTRVAKKPLVLTPRASRTWWLASLLAIPPITCIAAGNWHPLVVIGLTIALAQSLPLLPIVASLLLMPIQDAQNKKYLREAAAVLARLRPTIIGITGSFGKTSTKYILNHILNAQSACLATPGSINTPLGIARIVREQLQQQHQYFIAEMGAYAPGSIARLCKLAPPQIACITALGHAHYERFKSLETVAKAKFEIAEATIANGGICILNADAIPDSLWQPRVAANPGAYRLVTVRPGLLRDTDYLITQTTQTPAGTTLALRHRGKTACFTAPLFGGVQAGNIAVAIALAMELGLRAGTIGHALATAQPAPHRLNVQHNGRQTIIDDSYNANPAGLATALETLTLIAHANPKAKRRRVLITPGMVELGEAHDAEHARLGALAAEHADVILAVHPSRIPTFLQAVRTAHHPRLHPMANLAAAKEWMLTNTLPDDVILIANDLPDRYESSWNL